MSGRRRVITPPSQCAYPPSAVQPSLGDPPFEQGIDEVMLNEFMSRMREENLILVSTLMEETQQQNEAQLIEAVSVILEYMEAQRRHDLRLVEKGLAEIEEENYHRYIQTNETLGELLYTIHQQQ
jgi:hypothetical protein